MALGARIREARGEMDQLVLCAKVPGLTQQALSNLETRDSKTSELAVEIADALEVSVRWLLTGEGDRGPEWPFSRIDRRRIDHLSENERGFVEGVLSQAIRDCETERNVLGPQG